jgi:GT2 family glycosyltransferase
MQAGAQGVHVSVVSHGHGRMVAGLVRQLLASRPVVGVTLTLNVPENPSLPEDPRLRVRRNTGPKGFGANHNAAFPDSKAGFFCVLNPDVSWRDDPFEPLLRAMDDEAMAVVAPLVVSPEGRLEDSARRFPTLRSLAAKLLGRHDGTYPTSVAENLRPDWVAGMFLLLQAEAFRRIGGFDENFTLYYEDVDLCRRLREAGYDICQVGGARVVHDAQRRSRSDTAHALLHAASMMRYLLKYRAW